VLCLCWNAGISYVLTVWGKGGEGCGGMIRYDTCIILVTRLAGWFRGLGYAMVVPCRNLGMGLIQGGRMGGEGGVWGGGYRWEFCLGGHNTGIRIATKGLASGKDWDWGLGYR